ncbi:DUF4349 domain-containing protein [Streptomyces jumonjinensis]|uniref:DUF4349 domain-containing protein n=1 Tax=Streptomyces jumonjinensis TaxID=1945 RepID=UPI0037883223
MRARRAFTALMLISSLAVAGCGAGGSDAKEESRAAAQDTSVSGAYQERKPGTGPREAAAGKGSGKPAPDTASALTGAHVIRTAELSVRVASVSKALVAVRGTAVDAGGHLADERTERLGGGRMTSTVVVRVPQERYDEVLAELAGAGKLLERASDAKDVTDQVVDVRSRISSQRASVARVRELMDRAEKLSDVVTLEGELSSRQSELEALLARQESLKDRTSLATITVTLSEPAPKKAGKSDDDGPGFLDALGGGWRALTATAGWIAVAIGAAAPFAAVLGLGYVLWRRLVRPRLRSRTAAAPAHSPTAGPEGS